ncbi:phytanoyl-CoA dioxygenase family protein [Thalassobaculum sp. OXR-137]|uniref:phytanoyl-CoA dioxygenase family protein n=1 Tax=Thalassobaculum sp. OXR-137 TaxID=3100173 RepID=UPI002AC99A5F|nr:phytanoyl-CoA dioxygenase family protein [Thalassobaculum sp. OXR-137]WPZ33808.1 phytanoyl-CoA dioxygenase family protein [Thalassobaculum sp. OXR-137]
MIDPTAIPIPRAEHFPSSGPVPWLDRDDAETQIDAKLATGEITRQEAEWCRYWREHGYVILKGAFPDQQLEQAWHDYEAAIDSGTVVPVEDRGQEAEAGLPGRVLNPHFKVPAIDALLCDEHILKVISMLLGVSALPFQTIMGHKGSQQLAHSDSIHMTTYPLGYLAATWLAFEDIHDDSGPLVYYPGSHKLDYAFSGKIGISVEDGQASYVAYHNQYEPYVQNLIETNGLEPTYFDAKKGDVLIWHANLLHGGSPRRDRQWSRKALVCHYFAEGCVCYHDYTASMSHLTNETSGLVAKEDFDAKAYLAANPDVAQAKVDAYKHYITHGFDEGRPMRP